MINIIQIGMGPLGIKMAQYIAARKGFQTVAAVDVNPQLVGQPLKQLAEELSNDVHIEGDITTALSTPAANPQVALLTTVSDVARITPQIEAILAAGIPVVSTCEELSFPWQEDRKLAKRLDDAAKTAGVGVVGTGVNPGFLMDALPSFLSSVCQEVESVKVQRFQDATARRVPFQKKIGAGLSLEQFQEKVQDGSLRHVGLSQSVQFIADKLGWQLDKTEDIISPVIAEQSIQIPSMDIAPGQASGVRQLGKGWMDGEVKILLEFQAAIGEAVSYDEVQISGKPNVNSRIEGGVNGDIATCAITINAIRPLLQAQPGLHTMGSIPSASFWEA
ncbi:MAG: dihydrodipicolinate reductase [Bacteroidota bacterium]